MSVYQTPGVHVRAVQPPPAIRALRTDVAGLVGIAERGPLHEAVRTTSWEQFRATFGGLRPGAWLPHAVQGFFSNGGRVAWIVRVADPDAASSAWASVPSAGSSSRLIVRARSPGAWGRRLVARLTRLILASTTLDGDRVASTRGLRPGIVARVRRPGAADQHVVLASVELASGRVQWRVPPAGLGPARLDVLGLGLSVFEQSRLVEQHSGLGLDAFAGVDRPAAAEPPIAEAIAERSTRIFVEEAGGDPLDLPLQGDYPLDRDGADGLSTLRPDHFAGEATQARVWGLHALHPIDEVALLVTPDAVCRPAPREVPELPPPLPPPCVPCEPERPPAPPPSPTTALEMPPRFELEDVVLIQQAMLSQCEQLRDRFALLDPPEPRLERGALSSWRNRFDSSFGAVLYPWLTVADPGSDARATEVPPSGHVAGSYAQVDLSEGVHAAAANRRLEWAAGLTDHIDDRAQSELNPAGVNCLRSFPGRGLRLYGARTASSDSSLRYVNVRRLLMMVAEALEEQLAWAAFEPHDFVLRQKIVVVAGGFLRALWTAGALRGASPAEAYFVRCDDTTNPPEDVRAGRLRAEIGLAIVRPAEFIVLRLGRTDGRIEIDEEAGSPWR